MATFQPMFKVIPEGIEGDCTVSHFGVDEQAARATSLRAVVTGRRDAYVAPGVYCQLTVKGALMMSDTSMEKRSNLEVVRMSRGNVLIAGLGLGMVLLPILEKDSVTSVTVIEKYADVVKLVEPSIRKAAGEHSSKLKVIVADIFEWQPPKAEKWDTIYFDIWPTICLDNLEEMTTLHRKFARKHAPGAWVDSWMRSDLKAKKRSQAERTVRYGVRW